MPAAREPIPGLFLQTEGTSGAPWRDSGDVKRRHFVVEGQTLKLFGKRGKTYKGHLNLVQAVELKQCTDTTAPAGAFELHVRGTRSRAQMTCCILAPDREADELFISLVNAVPSHVTSQELWKRHMGSRPAIASESNPREYHVGKTLGMGTFGKVCTRRPPDEWSKRRMRTPAFEDAGFCLECSARGGGPMRPEAPCRARRHGCLACEEARCTLRSPSHRLPKLPSSHTPLGPSVTPLPLDAPAGEAGAARRR